jgi:hypothetical protein
MSGLILWRIRPGIFSICSGKHISNTLGSVPAEQVTTQVCGLNSISIDPDYNVTFFMTNLGTNRTFTMSLDGAAILSAPDNGVSHSTTVLVNPGTHTISVIATGGSGPCTYRYNGNIQQTGGPITLGAGTFTFTQKDITGP